MVEVREDVSKMTNQKRETRIERDLRKVSRMKRGVKKKCLRSDKESKYEGMREGISDKMRKCFGGM